MLSLLSIFYFIKRPTPTPTPTVLNFSFVFNYLLNYFYLLEMGIKGLNNLIKFLNNEQLGQIKKISSYRGKKVAIDTEIILYKFKAMSEKQVVCDADTYGIYAIINHINKFLSNGILPVYVFDGKPPIEKQENCLIKRHYDRDKNIKELVLIESLFEQSIINSKSYIHDENIISLLEKLEAAKGRCITVNKDHRDNIKLVLEYLGVPYLNVEAEAEAVCVRLARDKLVDYVYSEDTDCVVFGVTCLDIDLSGSSDLSENDICILRKNKDDTFVELSCRQILNLFKLTKEQFVDMCILCGCDYCKHLRISPLICYQLIKEIKCIENINIRKKDTFKFQEARRLFLNTVDQINYQDTNCFKLEGICHEKINGYLVNGSIKGAFKKYLGYHQTMVV